MDAGRILSAGIVALAVAGFSGCGGGGDGSTTARDDTARSVQQLAQRLSAYTGVHAEASPMHFSYDEVQMNDPVGVQRFGSARIAWTKDDEQRADQLGAAKPQTDGWYESEAGERLAMPFGPHVVLRGFDLDHDAGRPHDLQAAARALRAAYEGRPELLPAAERSCTLQKTSPLRDESGACALDGVPTTFVAAPQSVRTAVLDAAVTGVGLVGELGSGSVLPTRAGEGRRYVVVSYRISNRTRQELVSDDAELRVGERVYPEDRRASAAAGSSAGAIPPGGGADRIAAFSLPEDLADRARQEGALVVPTGLRSAGLLTTETGQGWIRLAKAPSKLPEAATPSPQQRAPSGPPNIPVQEGTGIEYGEAARGAYHASMFFPIPANFRPGPIHAGTVAGECTVPAPTDADRAQIADMARAAYPKDTLHGIYDKSLLLAECGSMGDFGIVFWGHDRKGHDVISGVELVRRDGRWVENKGKFYPGCTIPLDAAAAWRIDVSPCPKDAPRPHPRGDLN